MLQRSAARSFFATALMMILCPFADAASAQVLLRGTKPQDFGKKGTSASTTGVRKSTADSRRAQVAKSPTSSRGKSSTAQKPVAKSSSAMSFAEAVALQAALDRNGFSPGIIDGLIGSKTIMGLKSFQSANGLPATGTLDKETRTALRFDLEPATTPYRLTADDVAQVGECPADWIAKSKATRLGFDSLTCVAAFHGHCSRKLVERLNIGKDVKSLKAGDVVIIPNVKSTKAAGMAARLEIHFDDKIVRAFDSANRLVGLFHCSIARETKDRPAGNCKVASITKNPNYTFKPESWPEVKGIDRNLEIPPGPRNPVGLCWIGLDKKGYGIHGTPEPELIGKTGSHGCIRLTNWDVLRLAEFVSVGTEVRFVDRGERTVAQAN